jgi:hypothetical protein
MRFTSDTLVFAGVAQLVEHHLAKVDVESSSLFARSIFGKPLETDSSGFFMRESREERAIDDFRTCADWLCGGKG